MHLHARCAHWRRGVWLVWEQSHSRDPFSCVWGIRDLTFTFTHAHKSRKVTQKRRLWQLSTVYSSQRVTISAHFHVAFVRSRQRLEIWRRSRVVGQLGPIPAHSSKQTSRINSLFQQNALALSIDYRCDHVKMIVLRCPKFEWRFHSPKSLSSSETGLDHGIRSWKQNFSEWARCQKATGCIYFAKKKKWRAETLQPGLEFDNFKHRGLKAVSSNASPGWTVRFWGWLTELSGRGSRSRHI